MLGFLAGMLAAVTDAVIVLSAPIVVMALIGKMQMVIWAVMIFWPILLFFPIFGVLRGLAHGADVPTFWGLYRASRRDLYRVGEVVDPFQKKRGFSTSYWVHFFIALGIGLVGLAAWTYPLWQPRLMG